jgi:hypothetical protein
MARGWESKSVEEQQAEFSKGPSDNKKGASAQDTRRATERQRLKLARANVENQLRVAQNPRYKELLTRELGELDRQIESLA